MKKVLLVVFALSMTLVLVSGDLFANNSGVGIGSVLLKGQRGKVMEVIAVTLNGCSGTITFGITTGTSGYREGQAVGVNLVDVYVAENMDSLANDIAKGEGEYLDTLAHLMKVENKDAFKSNLHNNFNKIFTSKDVTSKEVVANINALI